MIEVPENPVSGFVLHHGGGRSPASLVDDWEAFVASCREGYGWPIEEYDNEIGVRDRIQELLDASTLHPRLAGRIAALDADFRALLQPGPAIRPGFASWWRRGILASAGGPYVEDVHNQYGLLVRVMA